MNKKELMDILSSLPDRAEVLVNIGERYAEIKEVKLECSQRVYERKPYVIIDIFI